MDIASRPAPPGKPKLLDRCRREIRTRRYSQRTEEAYVSWIRRFLRFHGMRHPRDLGKREIEGFLSHLATGAGVSAATQNQALAAILFLYRDVLGTRPDWLDDVVRAKKPKHLPVVLTREEARRILAHLHGEKWIAAMLLYGSGLRLLEPCGCGSRMSTSATPESWSVRERGTGTGSPSCRSPSCPY